VRRFRWSASQLRVSRKKGRFCSQLFLRVVRRAKTAGTEQTGCLPERLGIAPARPCGRRTVQVENM
jgi:hypothetical protein